MENSGISWTDHTFNPWIGCTRVGPGCDHCYAARDNGRFKWVASWGETGQADSPRKRTSEGYWKMPLRWNLGVAGAKALGITAVKNKVFCASLADVFDNAVPAEWRADLWDLIEATPHLRWILLTKRIGNVTKLSPRPLPRNAGIMATIVNQEEWDRDFQKLMAIDATWHGVSAEPLLGRIDMGRAQNDGWISAAPKRLDWMITGGESGPVRRELDMEWVRDIRDQCRLLGVTFHHKQNGGLRGKDAGCLIDGVEHKHFPPELAA
jgi:protein gp37